MENAISSPPPRPVAEQLELDREPVADVVDVGVDASGKPCGDLFGIGAVAGPLLFHVAAEPHLSGEQVSRYGPLAQHLGQLALAGAAPPVDLEQSILGGDEALG